MEEFRQEVLFVCVKFFSSLIFGVSHPEMRLKIVTRSYSYFDCTMNTFPADGKKIENTRFFQQYGFFVAVVVSIDVAVVVLVLNLRQFMEISMSIYKKIT